MTTTIQIVSFQKRHQQATADLINAGLGERFGFVDTTMNPDLYDIAASFAGGVFLVALDGETLVATGSLMPVDDTTGQISRMHTKAGYRRQGIASKVLSALEARAAELALQRLVLETNVEWADAIRFYAGHGYQPTVVKNGEQHFEKPLSRSVT
ncbi:MAG: GNAT family N-acetyltransferase [Pseudomonadota bacterium]